MRPIRIAVLIACFATFAGQVSAAEKPKTPPGGGRYVDLLSTALPIVWQGRLVNYDFVKLRLLLAPSHDAMSYRPKAPILRDALVRAAHRRPLVRPDDVNHVDQPALKRLMLAESARLLGPGVVTGVVVLSETPEHAVPLPRSPQARNPIP